MLDRIEINNFQPYGRLVRADFGNGLILVNGMIDGSGSRSNGAGKSSLFDAMAWCLFGLAKDTSKYPAGDHLIRSNPEQQDEMSVTIYIAGYEITRIRKKNKYTELKILHNGNDISGKSISDTQAIINKVLNVDEDIYTSTIYYRQMDNGNICSMQPKESKQLLLKILNTSTWEQYKDYLSIIRGENHSRLVDQESARKVLVGMIDDLGNTEIINPEILTHKISEANVKLDGYRRTREALISNRNAHNDELNKLSDHHARISKITDDIVMITKDNQDKAKRATDLAETTDKINRQISKEQEELQEVRDKLAAVRMQVLSDTVVKSIESELETLTIQQSDNQKVMQENRNLISICRTKIGMYKEKLDKIVKLNDKCPQCMQEISDEYKDSMIDGFKTMITVHEDQIREHEKEIEKANAELSRLFEIKSKVLQKLKDNDKIKTEISILESDENNKNKSIKSNEDRLTETLNNIKFIKSLIEKQKETIANLTAEKDGLSQKVSANVVDALESKVREINNDVALIDSNIADITNRLNTMNKELGESERIIKTLNKYRDDLTEMEDTIKVYEKEDKIMEVLYDAFSINGIPSFIIANISSQICDIANDILRFIDIPYSIDIKVFKENKTKKGKMSPTFDIEVMNTNTGIMQNYSQFSGGESFWIDLSIRLAFMITSLYKRDSSISYMIFDEGIARLDTEYRDLFIQVLRYMVTKYGIKQVFLVSHTDLSSYVNQFDTVVTVTKEDGIATLV